MAQYFYNYLAASLGDVPNYITLKRNSVAADYQILDADGTRVLRFLTTSVLAAKGASYNAAVSAGATELYAEIRDVNHSNPVNARLVMFATDSPDNEYGLLYDHSRLSIEIYVRTNGTYSRLSTFAITLPNDQYFKLLLRVIPGSPNQLKAKAWLSSSGEPETWGIETTHSRTLSGGWLGHVGFTPNETVYYKAVGIGTNDDPAPRQALTPSNQAINASAIISAEQFGQLGLSPGTTSILATAIDSNEQFGIADFIAGPVSILASGIPSEEIVSPMALYAGGSAIFADGIASDEQFGDAGFMPGPVAISAVAIASTSIVSSPELIAGPAVIYAESIPSGELFGDLTIFNVQQIIRLVGISTTEAFGSTTLEGGADLSGWLTGRLNIKPALTASVGVNRVH